MSDMGGRRLVDVAMDSPGWASRIAPLGDPFDANRLGHPCEHRCTETRSRTTVSVLIPTWNSADSLITTLGGIELSSLNRHAGHRLQVLVCDDGSQDNTMERVARTPLDLNVDLLTLEHWGQSYSINSGLDRADGDVVVVCDSDMLLGCGALDELVIRVESDRAAVPFGFRSDIRPNAGHGDRDSLWDLMHREALSRDNRFWFHMPTLVTNMMLATSWTSALDYGRELIDCEGSVWRRHRFLFGALFAVDRDRFRAVGGMPTSIPRWGYQDTLIAARLEADGGYVMPVAAAHGHHLGHDIRHPDQWFQYDRNHLGYRHLLNCPLDDLPWHGPAPRSSRSESRVLHRATGLGAPDGASGPVGAPIPETAAVRYALGQWKAALDAGAGSLPTAAVAECLFRLERFDELTAMEQPSFWQALAHSRDGAPSAAAAALTVAAASDDQVAAYVASASYAELTYLAGQYDAQGLVELATLHREARSLQPI